MAQSNAASPLSAEVWQSLAEILTIGLCRRARSSALKRHCGAHCSTPREINAVAGNGMLQILTSLLSFASTYATAGILGAVIAGDAATAWSYLAGSAACYAGLGIVLAFTARIGEELRVAMRYNLTRYLHALYFRPCIPYWLSKGDGPGQGELGRAFPIDSTDQRLTQDVDDLTRSLAATLFGCYSNPYAGLVGSLASLVITLTAVTALSPLPAGVGLAFALAVGAATVLLADAVSRAYFVADTAMGALRGHYGVLACEAEEVCLLRGQSTEARRGNVLLGRSYWATLRYILVSGLQAALSGFAAGAPYLLGLTCCLILCEVLGPNAINSVYGMGVSDDDGSGLAVNPIALATATAIISSYISALSTLPALWSSFARTSGSVARVGVAVTALHAVSGGRQRGRAVAGRTLGLIIQAEEQGEVAQAESNESLLGSSWVGGGHSPSLPIGALSVVEALRGWTSNASTSGRGGEGTLCPSLHLLAPSGTGKTSSMRVLSGLWPACASDDDPLWSGLVEKITGDRPLFVPQGGYVKAGCIIEALGGKRRAGAGAGAGNGAELCPSMEDLDGAVDHLCTIGGVSSSDSHALGMAIRQHREDSSKKAVQIGAWIAWPVSATCFDLLQRCGMLASRGTRNSNSYSRIDAAESMHVTGAESEAGSGHNVDRDRAVACLHAAGLHNLATDVMQSGPSPLCRDWLRAMSGGERQRLALARVLMITGYGGSVGVGSGMDKTHASPRVFLDEALGSLDSAASSHLLSVLRSHLSGLGGSLACLEVESRKGGEGGSDAEGRGQGWEYARAGATPTPSPSPSGLIQEAVPLPFPAGFSPEPVQRGMQEEAESRGGDLAPAVVLCFDARFRSRLARILRLLWTPPSPSSWRCLPPPPNPPHSLLSLPDPGSNAYVALLISASTGGCVGLAGITVWATTLPGTVIDRILAEDYPAAWAAVGVAWAAYVLSPLLGAATRALGRACSAALYARVVRHGSDRLGKGGVLARLCMPKPPGPASPVSHTLGRVDQRLIADSGSLTAALGTLLFGGDGRLPLLQVCCTILALSVRMSVYGPWTLLCVTAYTLLSLAGSRYLTSPVPPAVALLACAEGLLRGVHTRTRLFAEPIAFQGMEGGEGRDAEAGLAVVTAASLSLIAAEFPARTVNAVAANMGTVAAYGFAALLAISPGGFGSSPRDAEHVYTIAFQLMSLLLYAAALPDYLTAAGEVSGYTARVGALLEALDEAEADVPPPRVFSSPPAATTPAPLLSIGPVARAGSTVPFTLTIRRVPGVTLVAGASGTGKSSAIRCLAGLWPTASPSTLHSPLPDSALTFLPQKRYVLSPPCTLLDNVVYPHYVGEGAEGATEAVLQRASSALSAVGLATPVCSIVTRTQTANTSGSCLDVREALTVAGVDWKRCLSGGEAARLALARLICHAPALCIADEPFSGLDDAAAEVCAAACVAAGVHLLAFQCAGTAQNRGIGEGSTSTPCPA